MINEDLLKTIRAISAQSSALIEATKIIEALQPQTEHILASSESHSIARRVSLLQDDAMKHILSAATARLVSTVKIPEIVFRLPSLILEFDKAGLTPNLGEARSNRNADKYRKLLKMGYAIFWVPRVGIVNSLLKAKTEQERKQIIVSNRNLILDDCALVINDIDQKYLKDFKLHLLEAIESMQLSHNRAAQASASICFDALLDQLVDATALRSFRSLYPKIAADSQRLKMPGKLPVRYLYASMQMLLIQFSMRGFERLRPRTVSLKFGRHSSIHSVSARQYNEFNALQAIMITTSLLATTAKLGKGWLTGLADKA